MPSSAYVILSTFYQELFSSCWPATPIIEKECYISDIPATTWIIYGSERKTSHSTYFGIAGFFCPVYIVYWG